MKFWKKDFWNKKENLYLVLAFIMGSFMVFFNPPFAGVPDEGAHFLRATDLAQGNVVCRSDNTIDKEALGLAEELKPIKINGSNDDKISLGKIKRALFEKDSREQVLFGGALCGTNPLGYVPQVLGISMAGVFDVPVLWGFYAGRFLNMLAAVTITFFALRLLPFGKIIFLLIALLPMTMQQYASFSYDALHISSIFLFIAYLLNLATKEKITKKEFLQLGIISVLAANIKWGFVPILFALFILPSDKFKLKRNYWLFILGTIASGVLIFLLSQLGTVSSDGAREGVFPLEQIVLVLKNPLNFLFVVFNTIYSGANFFFETFLFKPGWLDNSLSPLFYMFVFLGMVFLIKNEEEVVGLSTRQRVIIGTTFLLGLLFVFFSLYVFWSKVGGDKVQGVQGRYLLAIFPMLILAFYKSNFDYKFEFIRKNISKLIIIFVFVVFVSAFVSLWSIYYDKREVEGKYLYEQQLAKEEKNNAKTKIVRQNFVQTFETKKDKLVGIKFYLKKNTYFGKATFVLKDAGCGEIVRKKELVWDGDEFGAIEVKFGVVTNSKNNKYCIEGIFDTEEGLPFKIFNSPNETESLKLDGAITPDSLVFDIMHKN